MKGRVWSAAAALQPVSPAVFNGMVVDRITDSQAPGGADDALLRLALWLAEVTVETASVALGSDGCERSGDADDKPAHRAG